MINGAHVVVYSQNEEADRSFFREIPLPGGGAIGLYQPKHPTPNRLR
jgi:hypothetical protein